MISGKGHSEHGDDLDESVYKSCFARSMAVNSHFRQVKCPQQAQTTGEDQGCLRKTLIGLERNGIAAENDAALNNGLRKGAHVAKEAITSSRRSSVCSNRMAEMPVENFFLQSQMETLQWQLKETEASREMYRAVMKQIVMFLERAHRSLEIIGCKLNGQQTVPRSKSDQQMTSLDPDETNGSDNPLANSTQIDFTWRKPRKQQLPADEVSPEKLSQEAFRLLRTAQSLLNTREPDLAQVNKEPADDLEFMVQLAKEFPLMEPRPPRTTSFSLSPKLILPERDTRSPVKFNRKFSLPLTGTEQRRTTLLREQYQANRGSITESDVDLGKELGNSEKAKNGESCKPPEKSNSPPMGSVSSAEDESGFSSMNSFQDVGLPLVNSTVCEEVSTKEALLRSMLNGSNSLNTDKSKNINDMKLWQKPNESFIYHRRRNSSPADTSKEKTSLKVLWV